MNYDKNRFRDVKELDEHTAVGYLKTSEAVISKNNVRLQSKYVDALTDVTLGKSIKAYGLANLPLCTPQGEIVCGSRRLRAMKDKEWIPVLIRDDLGDSQQIEISFHENWARTNLSVEDEISALKKYVKENSNLSIPEVANRLGMPLTYITDRLQIDRNVIPLLNGQKIVRTEGLNKNQEKKSLTLSKASILARDWIPKEVREYFIEKIKTEGMGKEQLQREVGKWKCIQTAIDQEEDPEIKKKLEEKYSEEKALDVDPKTVYNDRARFHAHKNPNQSSTTYLLEDVEFNIEDFEIEGRDDLQMDVIIPENLKNIIDNFFLRRHGEAPKFQLVMRGKLPPEDIEELKKVKRPFPKEVILS